MLITICVHKPLNIYHTNTHTHIIHMHEKKISSSFQHTQRAFRLIHIKALDSFERQRREKNSSQSPDKIPSGICNKDARSFSNIKANKHRAPSECVCVYVVHRCVISPCFRCYFSSHFHLQAQIRFRWRFPLNHKLV